MFVSMSVYCQDGFIGTSGKKFVLNNSDFRFIGFNAYYLQSEAGKNESRYIVDGVFRSAAKIGVNVIRTWAFYESSSFSDPSVIRKGPYEIQESGLIALDYVLYKARQNGIYLVLTLSNNFPAFGGKPKYIEWANQLRLSGSDYHNSNDFFSSDSIRQWFKYYIKILLNRVNSFDGIRYKDDKTIFSWEIMNEAENPGENFSTIRNWYEDIASFIRSIDRNHLITTGENGYDIYPYLYSNADLMYNSSYFLFDGLKGTSFYENSKLKNIDYLSFHSYPEVWGLSAKAGKTWIKDHYTIAGEFNKPCLLGEFGIKENKLEVYSDWLKDIGRSPSRSAIVWQYLHPDVINTDGYGFNEYNSPGIMDLFQNYIRVINSDISVNISPPGDIVLQQNYPNPFNPVTTITYSLPEDGYVSLLEIYSVLGKQIGIIDKGFKRKGIHEIVLSFDNFLLSSGVYLYTLRASGRTLTRKMILLK